MSERTLLQNAVLATIFSTSLFIAACSSSDDGESTDAGTDSGSADAGGADAGAADSGGTDAGDGSTLNPDLSTVSLVLDSATTVPPANVAGASGEGSFSINTSTGAIAGSITVTGTSGQPNAAHIHSGGAGETGPVVIGLVGNDDGTVWTAPEDAALDAAALELYSAGNLYVNVHTAANPDGELRSQLVDANLPAPGSLTFTFRNTSTTQPMTPPVVALHNAPDAENGIRLFEVGQQAIAEVVMVAEDGAFDDLVDLAKAQIAAGSVSAADVAFSDPDNPGPLLPGATASLNLDVEVPNQVLSVVSMVVCTNDGFTGVDSRALSADASETFTAPIYDAGSETNVLTLDYWVSPCMGPDGSSPNLGDDENGAIALHPGQSGSENSDFDFPAGSEFLEITITRN